MTGRRRRPCGEDDLPEVGKDELEFVIRDYWKCSSGAALHSTDTKQVGDFVFGLLIYPRGKTGDHPGDAKHLGAFLEVIPQPHWPPAWCFPSTKFSISLINTKDPSKSVVKDDVFTFSPGWMSLGWYQFMSLSSVTRMDGFVTSNGSIILRARACPPFPYVTSGVTLLPPSMPAIADDQPAPRQELQASAAVEMVLYCMSQVRGFRQQIHSLVGSMDSEKMPDRNSRNPWSVMTVQATGDGSDRDWEEDEEIVDYVDDGPFENELRIVFPSLSNTLRQMQELTGTIRFLADGAAALGAPCNGEEDSCTPPPTMGGVAASASPNFPPADAADALRAAPEDQSPRTQTGTTSADMQLAQAISSLWDKTVTYARQGETTASTVYRQLLRIVSDVRHTRPYREVPLCEWIDAFQRDVLELEEAIGEIIMEFHRAINLCKVCVFLPCTPERTPSSSPAVHLSRLLTYYHNTPHKEQHPITGLLLSLQWRSLRAHMTASPSDMTKQLLTSLQQEDELVGPLLNVFWRGTDAFVVPVDDDYQSQFISQAFPDDDDHIEQDPDNPSKFNRADGMSLISRFQRGHGRLEQKWTAKAHLLDLLRVDAGACDLERVVSIFADELDLHRDEDIPGAVGASPASSLSNNQDDKKCGSASSGSSLYKGGKATNSDSDSGMEEYEIAYNASDIIDYKFLKEDAEEYREGLPVIDGYLGSTGTITKDLHRTTPGPNGVPSHLPPVLLLIPRYERMDKRFWDIDQTIDVCELYSDLRTRVLESQEREYSLFAMVISHDIKHRTNGGCGSAGKGTAEEAACYFSLVRQNVRDSKWIRYDGTETVELEQTHSISRWIITNNFKCWTAFYIRTCLADLLLDNRLSLQTLSSTVDELLNLKSKKSLRFAPSASNASNSLKPFAARQGLIRQTWADLQVLKESLRSIALAAEDSQNEEAINGNRAPSEGRSLLKHQAARLRRIQDIKKALLSAKDSVSAAAAAATAAATAAAFRDNAGSPNQMDVSATVSLSKTDNSSTRNLSNDDSNSHCSSVGTQISSKDEIAQSGKASNPVGGSLKAELLEIEQIEGALRELLGGLLAVAPQLADSNTNQITNDLVASPSSDRSKVDEAALETVASNTKINSKPLLTNQQLVANLLAAAQGQSASSATKVRLVTESNLKQLRSFFEPRGLADLPTRTLEVRRGASVSALMSGIERIYRIPRRCQVLFQLLLSPRQSHERKKKGSHHNTSQGSGSAGQPAWSFAAHEVKHKPEATSAPYLWRYMRPDDPLGPSPLDEDPEDEIHPIRVSDDDLSHRTRRADLTVFLCMNTNSVRMPLTLPPQQQYTEEKEALHSLLSGQKKVKHKPVGGSKPHHHHPTTPTGGSTTSATGGAPMVGVVCNDSSTIAVAAPPYYPLMSVIDGMERSEFDDGSVEWADVGAFNLSNNALLIIKFFDPFKHQLTVLGVLISKVTDDVVTACGGYDWLRTRLTAIGWELSESSNEGLVVQPVDSKDEISEEIIADSYKEPAPLAFYLDLCQRTLIGLCSTNREIQHCGISPGCSAMIAIEPVPHCQRLIPSFLVVCGRIGSLEDLNGDFELLPFTVNGRAAYRKTVGKHPRITANHWLMRSNQRSKSHIPHVLFGVPASMSRLLLVSIISQCMSVSHDKACENDGSYSKFIHLLRSLDGVNVTLDQSTDALLSTPVDVSESSLGEPIGNIDDNCDEMEDHSCRRCVKPCDKQSSESTVYIYFREKSSEWIISKKVTGNLHIVNEELPKSDTDEVPYGVVNLKTEDDLPTEVLAVSPPDWGAYVPTQVRQAWVVWTTSAKSDPSEDEALKVLPKNARQLLRPSRQLTIHGRNGFNASVNGDYSVLSVLFNGRPAYRKARLREGDANFMYLFYNPRRGEWQLSKRLGDPTRHAMNAAAWLVLTPDRLRPTWSIWDGRTWVADTQVSVSIPVRQFMQAVELPPDCVAVSGRKGKNDLINGDYELLSHLHEGRPCYRRIGQPHDFMYFQSSTGYWCISNQLGSTKLFADSGPDWSIFAPHTVKSNWYVWDGHKFSYDDQVEVRPIPVGFTWTPSRICLSGREGTTNTVINGDYELLPELYDGRPAYQRVSRTDQDAPFLWFQAYSGCWCISHPLGSSKMFAHAPVDWTATTPTDCASPWMVWDGTQFVADHRIHVQHVPPADRVPVSMRICVCGRQGKTDLINGDYELLSDFYDYRPAYKHISNYIFLWFRAAVGYWCISTQLGSDRVYAENGPGWGVLQPDNVTALWCVSNEARLIEDPAVVVKAVSSLNDVPSHIYVRGRRGNSDIINGDYILLPEGHEGRGAYRKLRDASKDSVEDGQTVVYIYFEQPAGFWCMSRQLGGDHEVLAESGSDWTPMSPDECIIEWTVCEGHDFIIDPRVRVTSSLTASVPPPPPSSSSKYSTVASTSSHRTQSSSASRSSPFAKPIQLTGLKGISSEAQSQAQPVCRDPPRCRTIDETGEQHSVHNTTTAPNIVPKRSVAASRCSNKSCVVELDASLTNGLLTGSSNSNMDLPSSPKANESLAKKQKKKKKNKRDETTHQPLTPVSCEEIVKETCSTPAKPPKTAKPCKDDSVRQRETKVETKNNTVADKVVEVKADENLEPEDSDILNESPEASICLVSRSGDEIEEFKRRWQILPQSEAAFAIESLTDEQRVYLIRTWPQSAKIGKNKSGQNAISNNATAAQTCLVEFIGHTLNRVFSLWKSQCCTGRGRLGESLYFSVKDFVNQWRINGPTVSKLLNWHPQAVSYLLQHWPDDLEDSVSVEALRSAFEESPLMTLIDGRPAPVAASRMIMMLIQSGWIETTLKGGAQPPRRCMKSTVSRYPQEVVTTNGTTAVTSTNENKSVAVVNTSNNTVPPVTETSSSRMSAPPREARNPIDCENDHSTKQNDEYDEVAHLPPPPVSSATDAFREALALQGYLRNDDKTNRDEWTTSLISRSGGQRSATSTEDGSAAAAVENCPMAYYHPSTYERCLCSDGGPSLDSRERQQSKDIESLPPKSSGSNRTGRYVGGVAPTTPQVETTPQTSAPAVNDGMTTDAQVRSQLFVAMQRLWLNRQQQQQQVSRPWEYRDPHRIPVPPGIGRGCHSNDRWNDPGASSSSVLPSIHDRYNESRGSASGHVKNAISGGRPLEVETQASSGGFNMLPNGLLVDDDDCVSDSSVNEEASKYEQPSSSDGPLTSRDASSSSVRNKDVMPSSPDTRRDGHPWRSNSGNNTNNTNRNRLLHKNLSIPSHKRFVIGGHGDDNRSTRVDGVRSDVHEYELRGLIGLGYGNVRQLFVSDEGPGVMSVFVEFENARSAQKLLGAVRCEQVASLQASGAELKGFVGRIIDIDQNNRPLLKNSKNGQPPPPPSAPPPPPPPTAPLS
eukprot:GHVL01044377.1.p1 GENE.GHVL01044377.1~~GHVL01044377.1.p1  ORF type:complete len:3367 (-),score=547.99 GHVL01044377.1:3942-14042(-)